jgi:hypothetical protein
MILIPVNWESPNHVTVVLTDRPDMVEALRHGTGLNLSQIPGGEHEEISDGFIPTQRHISAWVRSP